jgi:hypothetical protein
MPVLQCPLHSLVSDSELSSDLEGKLNHFPESRGKSTMTSYQVEDEIAKRGPFAKQNVQVLEEPVAAVSISKPDKSDKV